MRQIPVKIRGLNHALDGYRMLHLSDIHFEDGISEDPVFQAATSSQSNANIILITGDFVTFNKDIDPLIESLKDIGAEDGVFGILGNHDYFESTLWKRIGRSVTGRQHVAIDWQRLVRELERIGISVLVNEQRVVHTRSGAKLFIEGTDDPVTHDPRISQPNQEYDESDFKILLSHTPDILYSAEIAKKRFDVLLSGHTHGGQVRIPGIGPVITETEHASRRESWGTYQKNGMHVNVSNGIGHSNFPLRINCPAEVCLIELQQVA